MTEIEGQGSIGHTRWEVENRLARQIIDARRRLLETTFLRQGDALPHRAKLERLEADLAALGGRQPMGHTDVGTQFARNWAGIPAGQMLDDDATRLVELETRLKERVLGQPEAIGELSTMRDIVRLKLGRVGRRVMQAHGVAFYFDENAVDWIATRCTEVESAARNVDAIIDRTILPEASRTLWVRASGANADRPTVLTLGMGDGGFTYTFTDAVSMPVETGPSFETFVDDEQFLIPVG